MLNQFIQICIQIRNAGHAAIGCLIDGLVDLAGGFLGYTLPLIDQGLTLRRPRLGRGLGEPVWLLGKRGRLMRLQVNDLPRVGELGWQG